MFTASLPPSIVASVTSALTQVEARPELRKFFVQDGFGILLVKEAGIEVCLITMSDTPAIRKRIDRLKIRFGHMGVRSEEHTSELQSLMRISYAVFCLKK